MAKKKTSKPHILIEIFGWYGAVAIVTAYALISYEILLPESLLYQMLNLSGSAGILLSAYVKKDYQPAFLNVVWIMIAISAIFSISLQ